MDQLYRKNAKVVYYFLLSRCQDEQLAEDLMQETFFRAYKTLNHYDGSCKMSVWLCQIAKHVWYQYLQKHKKELIQEIEEKVLMPINTIEENFFSKYDMISVLKELHKLPNEMREVMYLRMATELPFKDIGALLEHSENWARVTYFRGKEKIMKGLMKDE